MSQQPSPSTRGATVTQVGAALAAVVLVVDVVADGSLGSTAAVVLKGLALLGAVLAAGACYQTWGSVPSRTAPLHAAALLGLAGGASVAGAVFSQGDFVVFGNRLVGLVGVCGLVLAALAITRWRAEATTSR